MPILCSIRVTAKPVGRDLDDEARSGVVPGSRRRRSVTAKTDDEVGDRAVADEPLRAVDDVVVAVAAAPSSGSAATSEPASASVRANAMRCSPLASFGNQRAFCSSVPGEGDRQRAELLDREDQAGRGARAAELLDREADAQQLPAEAAVLLGERQREDVLVGEQPAEVLAGTRRSCRSRRRAARPARRRGRGRRRGASRAPRSGGTARGRGSRSSPAASYRRGLAVAAPSGDRVGLASVGRVTVRRPVTRRPSRRGNDPGGPLDRRLVIGDRRRSAILGARVVPARQPATERRSREPARRELVRRSVHGRRR